MVTFKSAAVSMEHHLSAVADAGCQLPMTASEQTSKTQHPKASPSAAAFALTVNKFTSSLHQS